MYSSPEEKPKWKQEPHSDQKIHLQTIAELQTKKIYEKPNIVIPYISPTVPPAPVSTVEPNESQGCDDNILPMTTTIAPPTPECMTNGEVVVVQSEAKYNGQIAYINTEDSPVKWNPFNKVVLDHRNGSIDIPATNAERTKRGLPVPWSPEIGEKEIKETPIQ
jgi:hypothetical protein